LNAIFGLADAFLIEDGLDDVIGERVGLTPQTGAVVAAGQNHSMSEVVRHRAGDVCRTDAMNQILGGGWWDKIKALNVKIEPQNRGRFRGETVQRHVNGFGVADNI
jgi:hypothetical protein